MISFACAQRGLTFRVKDEFAGRSTRWSTWELLFLVPMSMPMLATVEPESLEVLGSTPPLDVSDYSAPPV
jgi:hypothetical protein